jgi:hypothetical protein
MKCHGMAYRKGPHVLSDNIGPMSHGMEKDGASTLGDGENEAFGNPILPMRSNCTKGKRLLLLKADLLKAFSCINNIISSNIFNVDILFGSKIFKFYF